MPRGRIPIVLLGLVAVVAIAGAGVAVWAQLRERDLRMAKERELSLVKAENEGLNQQLQETREAKQHAESELSRTKEQLSQMSLQLVEVQEAKALMAKAVDDRQREIDRIGKDLQLVRDERDQFSGQIAQLKSSQEKLELQVSDLERAKAELETKLLEVSEQPTVELERVVVSSPDAPATAVSSTSGQVIVVNREYDFIVMNLGKNQGLEIGQEFQIVRGTEVLGRVKVEKVYDELSAAAILPDSKKDAIREGDGVVKAL